MIKVIKNTTAEDIFVSDVGQTFLADSSATLNPTQYPYFSSSVEIVPYVMSGALVVNDENYDLPPRTGLALLQDNQKVINEYYTLVDDDGVLVGNGKILQLYDEHWELEEDFEQDDVPTEE